MATNANLQPAPPAAGRDTFGLSGVLVNIMVHSSSSPGGKEDLPIGLNGRVYQIRRDVPVAVPEELLGVLDTAIETTYSVDDDGKPVAHDNKRIGYSRLGKAA